MLSYLETGNGQPVVLVHGNFAGKAWWQEILGLKWPGYRMIAPDLPGFGESEAPQGFVPSIPIYAQVLLGFIDRLGLGTPILVGHSLGGAVVMEAALREPDRFPALVLLDSAPPGGYPTPEAYYPILEGYRDDRQALAEALAATMPSRKPPYFERLVDLAQGMHPAGFAGNAKALASWGVEGQTATYAKPVFVIRGDQDALITPEMAEATAQAFPKGRLWVLEGVGHSPMIEAPARLGEMLRMAFSEVGR